MNTEHTNQTSLAEPVPHNPINLQSIPDHQRSFTAENIRDIAHDCIRIGDNDQAAVVFAIADALRDGNLIIKQQAEPVSAQSRFEGDEEWQPCTVAHHLLVQAHPKEWPHYETRALYTQPPSQPVVRDVLMAAMRAAIAECAEICDVYSSYKGARCASEIRHPIMNGKLAAIADRYAAQPPAVAEGCGACGDGCNGQGCRLERESPPTCQTCNGHGMIGGLLPNGGGYDGEPCPDCSAPQATAEDSLTVKECTIAPEGWQQQVFELCNDMMAYFPMTEAMMTCMYKSTGNRGKYPNAADWLARAALAAAPQAASESPAQWPQERDVGRIGDMSQVASLRVGLDADNDVYVSIANEEGMTDVEFCVTGSGGGKSPRTRAALISLMVAMEADNAETPSRDWWKAREGDAQKGGAA